MAAPISVNRALLTTNFLDNDQALIELVDNFQTGRDTSISFTSKRATGSPHNYDIIERDSDGEILNEMTCSISEFATRYFQHIIMDLQSSSLAEVDVAVNNLNSLLGVTKVLEGKYNIEWYKTAQFTTESLEMGADLNNFISVRAPLCVSRLFKLQNTLDDEGINKFYSVFSKHIIRQNPDAPTSIKYAKEHVFDNLALFERAYEDYTFQKEHPVEYAELQAKDGAGSDVTTLAEIRLISLDNRYAKLSNTDQKRVQSEIWKLASEKKGHHILEEDFGEKNLHSNIDRFEQALKRVVSTYLNSPIFPAALISAIKIGIKSGVLPLRIDYKEIPALAPLIQSRLELIAVLSTESFDGLPSETIRYLQKEEAKNPELFEFIRDSMASIREENLLKGIVATDAELAVLFLHKIYDRDISYNGNRNTLPILTIPKLLEKAEAYLAEENKCYLEIKEYICISVDEDLGYLFAEGSNNAKEIKAWMNANKEFLSTVRYLSITAGKIEFIPKGFLQYFPNLLELSIKNNLIQKFHPKTFSSLTVLKNLNLANNSLLELHPDTFKSLTALDHLNLSNNKLSKLPPNTFSALTALESLLLSNNHLFELDSNTFSALKALILLDLDKNNLLRIHPDTFSALTTLEELYLSKNNISEMHPDTFSGLTTLSVLNIENNKIAKIHPNTFLTLKELWTLKLSHNNISELQADLFKLLPWLYFLHLNNNNLSKLPSGIFSGLKLLRKVDLSNNPLEKLSLDTFEGLPNLKTVKLELIEPDVIPEDLSKTLPKTCKMFR